MAMMTTRGHHMTTRTSGGTATMTTGEAPHDHDDECRGTHGLENEREAPTAGTNSTMMGTTQP